MFFLFVTRTVVGLTIEQHVAIGAIAERYEQDLKANETKASLIARKFKEENFPDGALPTGVELARPPNELEGS